MEVCTILILLILDIKKTILIKRTTRYFFVGCWISIFCSYLSLSMYMYTTYAWQYTIKTKQENAQFQYALWNSFFFHFSFIIIWLCDVTFYFSENCFGLIHHHKVVLYKLRLEALQGVTRKYSKANCSLTLPDSSLMVVSNCK